jgi:hypothetical protein
MATLDDLRADQRAVLQLVLQQGRSYEEIADLLRIEPRAVRERARSALDALGPEDAGDLDLADQDEVADHLLGQQSASRRADTRALLESSAPARAWARVVSAQLRPLAGDDLPEVPEEGRAAAAPAPPAPAAAATAADPAPGASTAAGDPASRPAGATGAVRVRDDRRERARRSSRTGGVVLLGALGLLLVGVVLFALGVFDGDDDPAPAAATTPPPTTTTGAAAGDPRIVAQVDMRRGPAGDGARGVLFVAEQGGQRVLAISADGLRPPAGEDGPYYAVYFTGRGVPPVRAGYPDPQPTREAPTIQQAVPLPERLEPRPRDAERYDTILLTREDDRDREPDDAVLRASLSQARAR